MSGKTGYLNYQGQEIFLLDFVGLSEQAYLEKVKQDWELMRRVLKPGTRILIDMTDTLPTKEVIAAQKSATIEFKKYFTKISVVGLDPLRRLMTNVIINVVSDIPMYFAKTADDGMAWLLRK